MSLMLEEIRQQPDVLARMVQSQRPQFKKLGEVLRRRSVRLIVLVARGSSDNASLFGRYLLEITTGIPVSLAAPSVYTVYGAKMRLDNTLVVGVSQSGEGEDINRVLADARASGAFTIGITNEAGSSMVKAVDEALLIEGGKERSLAATKTFTGQMMMFYLLAEALGGKSPQIAGYETIPDLCAAALNHEPRIRELVQRYTFMENCVVLGRGLLYGNAYELALKLMETCYIVAERFSTADFFHGPLALVERHFPTIMFAAPGAMMPSVKTLATRLRELHAETLAITSDDSLAENCSQAVRMDPQIGEFLAPIPYMIPAQMFAALLAEAKGLNPDTPRSLLKVTRTL
jgi:glucosamine--fructose-6-phosphate aminotransferase (isomerizing)